AAEGEVLGYRRGISSWRVASSRSEGVRHLGFCGEYLLAVVSAGEPWLELWSVQAGLKTVASARLPNNVSAMAADNGRCLVGAANGSFQPFSIRNCGRTA